MKSQLYNCILSALFTASCSSQTTFVEYPVSIEGAQAMYIKDSKGDCYLNMPEPDGTELRIYDQYCDAIADSVAKASAQERFLFFHDRDKLDTENQQYFDFLLREARKKRQL